MSVHFDPRRMFDQKENVVASFTEEIDIRIWSRVSLQPEWTGNPTGTLAVWVTNDPDADKDVATGWTDLALTIPVNPAGTPGNTFLNMAELCAAKLKFVYTRTSGTADTFDCRVNAHGG